MDKIESVKTWLLSRVGNPYLMGGTGQFCTVAYRKARAAQYPGSAANITKYCQRMNGTETSCQGCQWWDESTKNGKRAYDCAQLTRWAMDSVGIPLVSGATSQWNKTAFAEKGEIAKMPSDKLCLIFRKDEDGKMGHVGFSMGDGTVIHARGHAYGVRRDKIQDNRWTHYGIPAGLYEKAGFAEMKKGLKGERVRALQEMLLGAGLLLPRYGADGDFGAETEAALLTFQAAQDLPETGICDEKTWKALEAAQEQEAEMGEEEKTPHPTEPQQPSRQGEGIALEIPRAAAEALQEALEKALGRG